MPESDAALREQFSELAKRWQQETAFLSSATEITSHPAYRQIIELGPRVLPLIFEALEREPAMWFAALRELTGENPVPEEERGRVQLMRATWLAWGKQRGYRNVPMKKSTDPGYPGPTNARCMLGKENCPELKVSRVFADGQHHACLQWPRCNRTVFIPFGVQVEFDADLPPEHEVNRAAAKAAGLRFDAHKVAYVDEEGCLIRDRFGQPY